MKQSEMEYIKFKFREKIEKSPWMSEVCAKESVSILERIINEINKEV